MEEQISNTPTVTELSAKDKSLAAFNHPSDADTEVSLGDRKFKVIYLNYDSYLEFLSLLQPLFDTIASSIVGKTAGATLPGIDLPKEVFSLPAILRYCKNDLPRLVVLTCNQQALRDGKQEDLVDEAWVKSKARSPFELAGIVAAQIARNKFITEISDFFVQYLPLYRQASSLKAK